LGFSLLSVYELAKLVGTVEDTNTSTSSISQLRPLEIYSNLDAYISEELPEPGDALSQVYDQSLPIPRNMENNNMDMEEAERFVVLTFANSAYFENQLIMNWMCSLKSLGVKNFVVIPIDKEAAEAAKKLGHDVLPPESIYWDPTYWTIEASDTSKKTTSSFRNALRRGFKPTDIFIEFIWRRAQLVRTLLRRYPNLNVVLSDADTTWAYRPWEVVPEYFNSNTTCDMFFTNDIEYGETEEPLRTVEPLSGFIMIRNRNMVQKLYREWIKAALVFHNKDQPSMRAAIQTFKFRFLIEDGEYNTTKGKFPLNFCTLSRSQFPTIQYIQSGLYGEHHNNNTDKITVYHPNFAEKTLKPEFFKNHSQWYLDESGMGCAATRAIA